MLYLIAHFQKKFPGEAQDPPLKAGQGKEIKLENRGVGKEIKLLGTLYTPAPEGGSYSTSLIGFKME